MASSDVLPEKPLESSAMTSNDQTMTAPGDNTTKTGESTGEAEASQEPPAAIHSAAPPVTSSPLVVHTDAAMDSGQSPPKDFDEHISDSEPSPNSPSAHSPTAEQPSTSKGAAVPTPVFPMSRVKKVIKEDRDIHLCSADAVYAIALAAQLFVENLSRLGQECALEGKRKTLAYKDLAKVVKDTERLEFLVDLIPTPMPLKSALEKRKRQEKPSD
ncbi:hypothetical protein IWQ62_004432 [Dispira parvispora]|uniref:Transcription factor CBF/NF-Y/archaeal histone domain-containing protein n=1 Tax=Dispira parvispora TaxID=1520584 RepID=A0A9W8ALX3_9FUNG|nr:hypothetical protein IWQ62_004432 [Dispira parvispora]